MKKKFSIAMFVILLIGYYYTHFTPYEKTIYGFELKFNNQQIDFLKLYQGIRNIAKKDGFVFSEQKINNQQYFFLKKDYNTIKITEYDKENKILVESEFIDDYRMHNNHIMYNNNYINTQHRQDAQKYYIQAFNDRNLIMKDFQTEFTVAPNQNQNK